MTYKGYTIQAAPHELTETGLWSLSVIIMWPNERGERSWHFSTSDRYATKEEATTKSIAYGELIIDGKIPGYHLDDSEFPYSRQESMSHAKKRPS